MRRFRALAQLGLKLSPLLLEFYQRPLYRRAQGPRATSLPALACENSAEVMPTCLAPKDCPGNTSWLSGAAAIFFSTCD
jgi:hypothetical protein